MATDKTRYTVSVDNAMFQQIEDFRFENRFQTRSEATVELIRLGLESLKSSHISADEPVETVSIAAYEGGGVKKLEITKEKADALRRELKKLGI